LSEPTPLEAGSAPLTAESIRRFLSTAVLGRAEIEIHPEIGSTNARARDLAQTGAPEGTLVLAESQTSGRGRLGRSWHSPAGRNLYFTLILKPPCAPAEAALIPLTAGLAGAEAIGRLTGTQPEVKWPNDLMLGGRKIAGILSEMECRGVVVRFVVLGVGLNVNMTAADLPPELAAQAGSLRLALGRPFDRAQVLAAFLNRLETRYRTLLLGGRAELLADYRQVCQTLGSRVQYALENELVTGTAEEIDGEGNLLVRREADGRMIRITAGDVSLLAARRP
jgi:BirA family biotin operon repressor/biotin-[acetyl-CoA-carboxylase] ligase